jgi:hypothetical protein
MLQHVRRFRARIGEERRRRRIYRGWVGAGRPVPPPPEVKQLIVRRVAAEHSCKVLVETGTYLGEMMAANHDHFSRLVSIELSPELWRAAQTTLRGAPNVTLLQGDSAKLLPGIVADLTEPTLFWLDAHYSGGVTALGPVVTPIVTELETIFESPTGGHVVLIDDARELGQPGYPSLDELRLLAAPREVTVEDDIARIVV